MNAINKNEVSMFKVGDLGRKRAKTKELPDLNYLKSLIQYCPNTGNIWWLDTEHVSKKLRGQLANSYFKSTGYKRICIDKKIYCQHRIAWLFGHRKEPVGMIDHINGIRDDNRLENLRDVSNSVNGQNKKIAMSSNRIGVLGVRYRKSRISKPYEACIKVNGKNKYLGNYSTPEEAHQAYLTAKRELHEGCTI